MIYHSKLSASDPCVPNLSRPIMVTPMHDGDGAMFPHLARITLHLKDLFGQVVLGVSPPTARRQGAAVAALAEDAFFQVVPLPDAPVGDQFRALFAHAAVACHPSQVLHLCFVDRVAFALQAAHRERFAEDVRGVSVTRLPLIFERSVDAWQTHPSNYRELEGMVRRAGELVLGRSLDFGWCHMVLRAGQLAEIMPSVRRHDMSMLAEMVLSLKDEVQTEEVDWLEWEDPFLEGRNPAEMRLEREACLAETRKRLNYVVPMLDLLREAVQTSG